MAATVESSNLIRFVGPALDPGGVHDVTVTNPGGQTGTVRNGYVSRFADVPDSSLFDDAISKLVAGGITAGIGGGNYGPAQQRHAPADGGLRPEGQVRHLLHAAALHRAGLLRRPLLVELRALGPAVRRRRASPAAAAAANYCPLNPVRRDQMAVFLLKGKYGSDFAPPPCAGFFDDVDCPGSPFAPGSSGSSSKGSPSDAAATTIVRRTTTPAVRWRRSSSAPSRFRRSSTFPFSCLPGEWGRRDDDHLPVRPGGPASTVRCNNNTRRLPRVAAFLVNTFTLP